MQGAEDGARASGTGGAATMLRGVPVGVAAFVFGSIGFGVIELREHPERLTAWVMAYAIDVALSGVALWVSRRVRNLSLAKGLVAAIVLAMAVVITAYTVLEHASWRMLTSGLVILLTGVALVIPLGVLVQAAVGAGIIAIYLAPVAAGVEMEIPAGLAFMTLAGASVITVVGVYLSERYSREAVAGRDAARREADVATTLIDIGHELNATLSRAEVLRRLARRASQLCGADAGAISLLEENRHLRVAEVSGVADDIADAVRGLTFDLNAVAGSRELLTLPLVEAPDLTAQGPAVRDPLRDLGYQAALIAPMHRGDSVLGTVAFVYRGARRAFSAHERQLARGLAEQAALALENARLYEEQQEAAHVATALVRVAAQLGQSLDPQQVLNDLAGLTRELLHCDGAAVYQWTKGRWRLAAAANPRMSANDLEEFRAVEFDADFPFFRELVRGGWIEIADSDDQTLAPAALLRRWHVRSSFGVVLARGSEPVAAITAVREHRAGPASSRERRILSGLAQLGMIAFTNAQLTEQLRSANRVKSEFVATMSHELRTPLNAILGYTDLLRDQSLGPIGTDQADALDRMRDRALDLYQLVQATLDLNRLEAGIPQVERAEIRLHEFLDDVRRQVPARWLKPSVRLDFDAGDGSELRLWTDPGKLHIILRNLIHNALKFTDTGEVRVSARPRDTERLAIEVQDTGCGIPADKIGEVFEMFVQAENSSRHDGVGLGLHLCRRFAHLLGGSIEVESQLGAGSTFRLQLPIGNPPAADRH